MKSLIFNRPSLLDEAQDVVEQGLMSNVSKRSGELGKNKNRQ